jgi:protein-arginine deiminase
MPIKLATLLSVALWPGLARADGPAIRVFADMNHTGNLTEQTRQTAAVANGFVIVAPLPAQIADRQLIDDSAKEPENFAPRLGRVRIEARPDISVRVKLVDAATSYGRLYRKTSTGWQLIAPHEDSWSLNAEKSGVMDLDIGVVLPEATSETRHLIWPTSFTLEISSPSAGDPIKIPIRVAPFIIPSALDPVEEILIVAQEATEGAVKSMQAFAERSKIKLTVHDAQPPADQWMQDTIEPGVFAFPSAGALEQVRGALTGIRKGFRHSSAALDRQVFERLQRDNVVTIAAGVARNNTRWIDWYGNLEVTPSHTDRQGRSFPYGRVLTGQQRDLAMHPGVMKFLEAQKLQWPPIVVDTSWLMIGHVDEAVNFVPAKTQRGYKVVLPSPMAARRLLDDLIAQGLGATPVFADTRDATTVEELRKKTAESDENRTVDEKVAGLRRQLKAELNLDDADFVMIPVLFRRGGAVIPNAVNSLVVNGYVVAPEPRGPRRDGKDLFEEAIRAAFAGCDVKVVFVDAWRAYHTIGGEIHCGTNTFRRLRDPAWWKHEVK